MASALCAKPCVGLRSSGLSAVRRSARAVVPVRAMADKAQVRPRVQRGHPAGRVGVLERLPRHVNLGSWAALPAPIDHGKPCTRLLGSQAAAGARREPLITHSRGRAGRWFACRRC